MAVFQKAAILSTKGVAYPFSLSGKTGTTSGKEYIESCIRSAIDISFFELLMRPEGSRIQEVLFEPLNQLTIVLLKSYVKDVFDSLTGISLVSVDLIKSDADSHLLSMNIRYSIDKIELEDVMTYMVAPNVVRG